MWCSENYAHAVVDAAAFHEKHFDGLCFDCIAGKKEEGNPRKTAEYETCRETDSWSEGCEVAHKESTWYFSYHAREGKSQFGP